MSTTSSSGLRAIEQALPERDGVRAFTALYRAVTEAVDERVRPGTFADARFTRWLDVVFANLYFRALRAHVLGPKRPPRAWAALFEARSRRGVAPIQFALAGMNAHINRDLPLALVETCRALDVVPARGCPQHGDFRAIDPLLAETEARVRADFATGLVGWADDALGELDSVVAMWNVRQGAGGGLGERRDALGAPRRPLRRRALRRHARPARRPREPRPPPPRRLSRARHRGHVRGQSPDTSERAAFAIRCRSYTSTGSPGTSTADHATTSSTSSRATASCTSTTRGVDRQAVYRDDDDRARSYVQLWRAVEAPGSTSTRSA